MANLLSRQCLAVPALSARAGLASFPRMKDLAARFEHYRARFREAFDARNFTNEGFAERIDVHPVTVSKLRTGKLNLDDEWRVTVAAGLGMNEAVLFGDDPLPEPTPQEMFLPKRLRGRPAAAANDNLPVFGLAAGSLSGAHKMTSEAIDEVPCPPGLRDVIGAYVLVTRGESMVPRYYPDERLYVNPVQAVKAGDHVIIQTRLHDSSGTETWVKRYEGETKDEIRVSQYNPPAQMAFKKRYVVHIHRVLPVNELF